MIICQIENTIKPEGRAAYLKGACAFANDQKQADGCIDALVLADEEHPDQIINLEIWSTDEKRKENGAAAFLKHKPQLKPYFLSNKTKVFQVLDECNA